MSRILNANKFEYVQGSRINSIQILYKNNLFNKHKIISRKCSSCSITLSIDQQAEIVIREPGEHRGHFDVTPTRIAVLKAINQMKKAAKERLVLI